MKSKIVIALVISAFAAPVLAEKPSRTGSGAPSAEQKDARRAVMETRNRSDHEIKELKDKKDKRSDIDGLEKQKERKSQQVQKELGKGSEKGQEARQVRKKWWQLWGE